MAAVCKIYQSLQSAAGTEVRLVIDTGVRLVVSDRCVVCGYLGSMPCIRISSCLHSTMSLVNMA